MQSWFRLNFSRPLSSRRKWKMQYQEELVFASQIGVESSSGPANHMTKMLSALSSGGTNKATNGGIQSKSKKIMIVDDEKQITKLYSMILSNAGYNVSYLEYDGIDAVKRIQDDKDLDIIVMDQRMPRM